MKKITLILTITILIAPIVFYSCKKKEASQSNSSTSTTTNSNISVLLNFNNANGNFGYQGLPEAVENSLISDGTYLYGMTCGGGTKNFGTVFKIKFDGTGYTDLHDFGGYLNGATDGANPFGSLLYDGTYLYGTNSNYGRPLEGGGVIFKIKPDGTGFDTLISCVSDGVFNGFIISDGTYFYGSTYQGGTGYGNIFKIKSDGSNYKQIYSFGGSSQKPYGTLLSDGTCLYGNNQQGIFKISSDTAVYPTITTFPIGVGSIGNLISDGTYFYSTTNGDQGATSNGSIFKIKPDGTGGTTLYSFDLSEKNGGRPVGGLTYDGTYLYGTANEGGAYGKGVLFKIKTDGTGFTKMADFDGTHGANPMGTLYSDSTYLYGMTTNGGSNGRGVIFKVKKN